MSDFSVFMIDFCSDHPQLGHLVTPGSITGDAFECKCTIHSTEPVS